MRSFAYVNPDSLTEYDDFDDDDDDHDDEDSYEGASNLS